jgi:hypothetical protein
MSRTQSDVVVRSSMILACLVCTLGATVQQSSPDYLIGLARAAKGPYAADVILRIAPQLELSQRAAAIEEAFGYGDEAIDLFPKDSPAAMDTLEAKYGQASLLLRLDRMSLQVRAARAMLSLDRGKARELFERIDVTPPVGGCGTNAIYDMRPYYEMAATIANDLSAADDNQNADLLFALRTVGRVTSPWQLEGIVSFISRLRMNIEKRNAVIRLLASQVRDGVVVVDPGAFIGLTRRVRFLARLFDVSPDARLVLLPAIEEYVKRQGTAPRCSTAARVSENTFRQINQVLCGTQGDSSCPYAVEKRHLKARSLVTAKPAAHLWQTPQAASAKAKCEALIFSPGRGPRRKERSDQQSDEWRDRFNAFMDSLDSWPVLRGDVLGAVERLTFLHRLLPVIPTSGDRLRALRMYFEALNALESGEKKSQLWFLYAKPALSFVESLAVGDRQLLEQNVELDPVLSLYAALKMSMEKGRDDSGFAIDH